MKLFVRYLWKTITDTLVRSVAKATANKPAKALTHAVLLGEIMGIAEGLLVDLGFTISQVLMRYGESLSLSLSFLPPLSTTIRTVGYYGP